MHAAPSPSGFAIVDADMTTLPMLSGVPVCLESASGVAWPPADTTPYLLLEPYVPQPSFGVGHA